MLLTSLLRLMLVISPYISTSTCFPLDQPPDIPSFNLTDGITPGSNDPFIYRTKRNTFQFSNRQTPHRILEKVPLARIDAKLKSIITKAQNNPHIEPTDLIRENYYGIWDDHSGAILRMSGMPVHKLTWNDVEVFEPALDDYLKHWSQFEHTSLVDILVFDEAKTLLAEGSAERGWPMARAGNETVAEVAAS